MRERMDIIESERKQWGDTIQKLKKERLQAAMTTRKKLEEVKVEEVHELTATEEEEKCHVCSQCKFSSKSVIKK
ncbi:hypothetical protein GBAR_LOCUS16235 [Geodia barretti]|uniref:Uncharacterized protein n=1 Tax=Geodia barretti TaxID=519541 RepID=A0AA35SFZ3_GEOBA|nr:hypothetical protein GBAR_LOCUS16235 [Geodia barretti]